MINIDLSILAEAIHGAPPPEEAAIEQLLLGEGITLPCHVIATYPGGQPPAVLGRLRTAGVPVLDQLHPGMAYAFPREPTSTVRRLRRAGLLVGDVLPCAGPAGFLRAVQQAIVSLRARELEQHRATGTEPDHATERAARDQAIHELQLHGDLRATELWLELVLYRHRHRLVAARRRLIEFQCLLTADLEAIQPLDHALRRGVQTVQSIYAFPELRTRFPELVTELLPWCHRGSGRRSELVQQALELMAQRHEEPIALADLASALGVSTAHLARRFKQETGRTVTEELHALRIASAKRLLTETDEGILQIALDCGFQSVEHFHRIFKRHTNTTPRRWRLTRG